MTVPGREGTYLRAHLGVRMEPLGEDAIRGVVPVSARSRTTDGQVSLGALATMIDVVALFGSRAHHSELQVTSHLAVRLPTAPADGNIYATSEVLRAGRTGVVSLVHVRDEAGAEVGLATVTSGSLKGGAGGGSHKFDRERRDDDFYRPASVPGDGPPIDQLLGLEPAVGADGRTGYRMAFHETLRNVNGVLHGGGGSLVIEQAGRETATDAGLAPFAVDSLDVHFIAPGLVGPFFAAVEMVGTPGGRHSVAVEVLDEGRNDRLVVAGLVGLGPRS
jgi:uncharacterized protein (TIGR00369 family)